MIHNIFIGNPGCGKSTLANTLLGEPKFRSGISLCSGLTTSTTLQLCPEDGQMYVDTPGLDDISSRERAAFEISRAINMSRCVRLIFVTTLEEGRVRACDAATIGTVLRACGKNVNEKMCGHFGVVVNQCSEAELNALKEDEEEGAKNVLRGLCGGYDVQHAFFAPSIPHARGKDNVMLKEIAKELRGFVQECPAVCLNANNERVKIEATRYEERVEEIMLEISMIKSMVNELRLTRSGESASGGMFSKGMDRDSMLRLFKGAAFAIAFGVLQSKFPNILQSVPP